MRARSDSSNRNIDVSGAMPMLSSATRGNSVTSTSIIVSVPGVTEKRYAPVDRRAVEQRMHDDRRLHSPRAARSRSA